MGVVGIKESIGNKLTTRINISHLSKKKKIFIIKQKVFITGFLRLTSFVVLN